MFVLEYMNFFIYKPSKQSQQQQLISTVAQNKHLFINIVHLKFLENCQRNLNGDTAKEKVNGSYEINKGK